MTERPRPGEEKDRGDSKLVVARIPGGGNKGGSHRQSLFRRFAQSTSQIVGTAGAFCAALLLILVWAFTGPIFHYSDTWQLVINTSTTIITFLMVFVIQHTQNRDTEALRLKLDELIRAGAARNTFIELEDLDDEQLKALHAEFKRLRDDRESGSRPATKGGDAAPAPAPSTAHE